MMNRIFFTSKLPLFIFSILSIASTAQRQTQNSFRSRFGPGYLVGYLAYVPIDYNANPTKNYPLLIFLHGGGEKAYNPQDLSNLYTVKKNGPPMLIESGQDFPFIVISPQCPFGDWDFINTDNNQTSQSKPGEFVDEILEKIKTLYRVDLDRIYLTGLSIGGAATWEYTQRHPEKIAASIPIAGWGDGAKSCDIAANNVPIWAFQGELDGQYGILGLVDQINSCQPSINTQAKATIYAGVGHNAWTETYDNSGPGIAPDNIYNWLMRQSKKPAVITDIQNQISENSLVDNLFNCFINDVSNEVNLNYTSKYSEEAILQIWNESSVKILEENVHLAVGKNYIPTNLSNFKSGLYFIKISSLTQSASIKTIVLK